MTKLGDIKGKPTSGDQKLAPDSFEQKFKILLLVPRQRRGYVGATPQTKERGAETWGFRESPVM